LLRVMDCIGRFEIVKPGWTCYHSWRQLGTARRPDLAENELADFVDNACFECWELGQGARRTLPHLSSLRPPAVLCSECRSFRHEPRSSEYDAVVSDLSAQSTPLAGRTRAQPDTGFEPESDEES